MTMTLIEHKELGSAQAGITFTSIPNTFTDIMILLSARATTDVDYISMNINGSTSNLSRRQLEAYGSGVQSNAYSDSNQTMVIVKSTWTANTFSNYQLYIPNYTSSNAKSWSVDAVTENNATDARMAIIAGLWNSTSVINSVGFTIGGGGNFAQYTSATLYGILKGSDGTTTVS